MRYFAIQKHRKEFIGSNSTMKIIAHDDSTDLIYPESVKLLLSNCCQVKMFYFIGDHLVTSILDGDSIRLNRRMRQAGIRDIISKIDEYKISNRLKKLKKI